MRVSYLSLLSACFISLACVVAADIPKPASLNDTLELLLDRLLPTFPQAQLNRRDRNITLDEDGGSVVNPDNIHAVLSTLDDGDEREVALDHFVASMVAAMNQPVRDPTDLPLDRVFPVVRHVSFSQAAGAEDLYFEPFVGDMIRVYAIDYPDHVAYVTRPSLSDADVSVAQLEAAARSNFASKREAMTYNGNNVSFMAIIDGFYESSLVLDAALWADVAAQLGNDIVMIVPTRDLLVFTPVSETDEVAFLDGLRADMLATGTHQLSDLMYIWRDGRWQVYDR